MLFDQVFTLAAFAVEALAQRLGEKTARLWVVAEAFCGQVGDHEARVALVVKARGQSKTDDGAIG
ncbi:MAG: hypothetical protein QME60_05300 [Verrucomicrobiota bacterium]|nr:hypothetical protein [Verrucomicrobiota bacterium]